MSLEEIGLILGIVASVLFVLTVVGSGLVWAVRAARRARERTRRRQAATDHLRNTAEVALQIVENTITHLEKPRSNNYISSNNLIRRMNELVGRHDDAATVGGNTPALLGQIDRAWVHAPKPSLFQAGQSHDAQPFKRLKQQLENFLNSL